MRKAGCRVVMVTTPGATTETADDMARNHQGLAHRIAEAQRRQKSEAKRLARLTRRQSKRKSAITMNGESI